MLGFSACFVPVELCYGWESFSCLPCHLLTLYLLFWRRSVCLFSLLLQLFVCLVDWQDFGIVWLTGVSSFVVLLRGGACPSDETSVFVGQVYECWQTVARFPAFVRFFSEFGEASFSS